MLERGIILRVIQAILLILALATPARVLAGDLEFGPHLPLGGGMPNSYNFRLGDLNGDGRMDIIVSEFVDARFFWYERKATVAPEYIAHRIDIPYEYGDNFDVGDVDGDGDLDIVSTGITSSLQAVIWYENNGGLNPAFTAHVVDDHNVYGRDCLIVDLDGDGDKDIVVSSADAKTIRWLENTGGPKPSFTPHLVSNSVSPDQVCSLVAADMDGDGDLDLLSASDGDGQIAWHENKGGTPPVFVTHTIANIGKNAWAVAAADLDGDGDQDVVAVNAGNGRVEWYENSGGTSPTFTIHALNSGGPINPYKIVIVDLDQDGDQDILAIDGNNDHVYLYANDGAAKPAFSGRLLLADYRPCGLIPHDLDGDGDLDLLSLNRGETNNLYWYRNDQVVNPLMPVIEPEEGFTAEGIEGTSFIPARQAYLVRNPNADQSLAWSVAKTQPWLTLEPTGGRLGPGESVTVNVSINAQAADLSTGVYLDQVVFKGTDPNLAVTQRPVQLTVKSHELSRLRPPRQIGTASTFSYNIQVADLNGDGWEDIVTTDWSSAGGGSVYWLEQDPHHPLRFTNRTFDSGTHGADQFAIGDLDGDGDLDLAVKGSDTSGTQQVAWLENDGKPQPAFTRHVVDGNFMYGRDVTIADLNGDGRQDIIATETYSHSMKWYENTGGNPPVFVPHTVVSPLGGDQVSLVAAADFDGDGDLDLMSLTESDHKLSWFENRLNQGQSFVRHILWDNTDYRCFVAKPVDFDHDGDPDILATFYNQVQDDPGKVCWFENVGGQFVEHVIDNTIPNPYRIEAVDLDKDGRLDLFVTSNFRNDDKIYFIENSGGASPHFVTNLFQSVYRPRDILAADLDHDGDTDVVMLHLSTFYLYKNHPIGLTQPMGPGIHLKSGGLTSVSWESLLTISGTGVRLELWNDQGRVADLGYGWSPDGKGTGEYYLPLLPQGADYRLRTVSTADPQWWDESDAPITITGSPVRVNRPSGGEVWRAGDKEWIWWQANPLLAGSGVRLELWRDGVWIADLGTAWDPDGEGVVERIVPSVAPGKTYRVRAVSVWNPSWFAESDKPFTILNGAGVNTAIEPGKWQEYD